MTRHATATARKAVQPCLPRCSSTLRRAPLSFARCSTSSAGHKVEPGNSRHAGGGHCGTVDASAVGLRAVTLSAVKLSAVTLRYTASRNWPTGEISSLHALAGRQHRTSSNRPPVALMAARGSGQACAPTRWPGADAPCQLPDSGQAAANAHRPKHACNRRTQTGVRTTAETAIDIHSVGK